MYKKLFLAIFCCGILNHTQVTKSTCAPMGTTNSFVYTYHSTNETKTITNGSNMCDFLNKKLTEKTLPTSYYIKSGGQHLTDGSLVNAHNVCGKNTNNLHPCCIRDGIGKIHTCG